MTMLSNVLSSFVMYGLEEDCIVGYAIMSFITMCRILMFCLRLACEAQRGFLYFFGFVSGDVFLDIPFE